MKKDFLSLLDFNVKELKSVLTLALRLKKERGSKKHLKLLENKTLALIFEKNSTRTRVSFEVAMKELGGHVVVLSSQESHLGEVETYTDTALVLSRYVHAIMLRTYSQSNLEELSAHFSGPVINGLSDDSHPVQIMADLLTLIERYKKLEGLKVVYLGDVNNITNSLIEAAMLFGFQFVISHPDICSLSPKYKKLIQKHKNIEVQPNPTQAVKMADVLYTDTWFSMGQSVNVKNKKKYIPYQINTKLLSCAKKDVSVLHCLPAHIGEEITEDVLRGPSSLVYNQAENRLHVQKALLLHLLRTK